MSSHFARCFIYKSVYYDTKRSRIFLWDQVNGKDDYRMIDWSPSVYIPHDEGNIKTPDGIPVIKREFNDFYEYQDFQKNSNNCYENNVDRGIQFLAETYHHVIDEDIEPPNLNIYTIDIETGLGDREGFARPHDPFQMVTLINVRKMGGANISWGVKHYTGENLENTTFVYCKSEVDLLQQFFSWMQQNPPDVITGWNIMANSKMNPNGGFDLPYLVNRSKRLFGDKSEWHKKLSPIGLVRTWEDQDTHVMNISIAGVAIIDYLALYKWYSTNSPDSYKLESICQLELGVGKLDYSEYGSLNDLFHKNWDMYVDYNVIDNKRIEELEDKLGYIKLAQSLALLCRCSMESYMSSTHLIEGLMLTYYRRNGLCAPRMAGGHQEWFPAAFVKDPQKGRHEWIVDLDVASSYPTAIVTMNMSLETYYGRLMEYKDLNTGRWIDMMGGRVGMDIQEVVNRETPITEFVRNREMPPFKLMRDTGITVIDDEKLEKFNKALKKGLICVAPCGTMFMTNKQGVYAQVCKDTYNKRVVVKKLQKQAKIQANAETDPLLKKKLEEKAKNLHALQWALKIVINSAYGVTGVPYSRYFNMHISEAVTSCGRRAIVNGEAYVNRLLNNPEAYQPLKDFMDEMKLSHTNTDIDFIAYVDTDSLFIRCYEFLTNNGLNLEEWGALSDLEKTDVILKLSAIIEKYVNDCSYEETQVGCYNSQVKKDDFTIQFKQEIVCKSALFVTKKKYGYHVVNKEHIPCDEVSVTGLEIIRSETPAVFRDALKEMLTMILRGATADEILTVYNKHRKVSKEVKLGDISENKGVKGISKYIVNGEPSKGTPYHVKAAFNYHKMLKALHLEDKYPEILEDSKNKLICVKANNYGIKCIMYDGDYPEEFERIGLQPDISEMTRKFFTKKLIMLLEPMKMEHIIETNQSFGCFFN